MKNKVLKSLVAVLLIFAITIADFALLGMHLVTYALESINDATGNDNIKFAAYFKTEEGKKFSEIEHEMNNNQMKLNIEVAVENEGYFDGVITIKDSNFKLKQDILCEGVSKIEGNTITLNRVRAGNRTEIEVGIEPIKEERYEVNMLNQESVLNLKGKYYKDSTEESTSIEANKSVTLSLKAPSNIETIFEGEVITNGIYKIGEENKRIVQIELNSQVVENAYPVKNTAFELDLPEGVEKLKVITKGTYATNGEGDRTLTEGTNYIWNKTNKLLQIAIQNTAKDGKIAWEQKQKDNVIVTLILNKSQEITEEEYSVKSKVQFQGEKELEKTIKYNLTKASDKMIGTSIENSENIYKGKIYSKEERQYNTTTNIEINYDNLLESATLEEKTLYRLEETSEDKTTNIEYKETIISKAEIERILGTTGTLLTVKDQNGNLIKEIKADTETDQNGNIIITYGEGIKGLTIEIAKAKETGIIRLNHTKVINPEGYTREELESYKYLVEQATVKYGEEENRFELCKKLLETTTEAALTIDKQTISAQTENEQIQIAVTLKADNERYELYKNPTFKFTLPEGVSVKSLSNGTISASNGELAISKLEGNGRIITLEVTGAQSKYVTSDINPQITFTAYVNIEKLMANKIETVKMEYTNRGITSQIESLPIKVIASNSKIVTNLKLENYNGMGKIIERHSDNSEQVTREIPIESNEIKVPVKYTIINNYDMPITINSSITASYTDKEENKQELLKEESQLMLEAGKVQAIEQTLDIPADLYYSETIEIETLAEYTYSGTEYSVPNNIELVTESKEGFRELSVLENKIQVETFAQLGDGTGLSNDDKVYNEQVVKYIIEVTNISNETVSNLKVTNKQTNGNIYDLEEVWVVNLVYSPEPYIEHQYAELKTDTKTFEIDKLEPGESKQLECRVVTKKGTPDNTTTANISVVADGIEEKQVQTITNGVKDSKIKINSRKALKEEVQNYGESSLQLLSFIENLTDTKISDSKIKIFLSEGLTFKNSDIEALDQEERVLDIIKDIQYNKEENYIELTITKLEKNQKITLSSFVYIEPISLDKTSTDEVVYFEIDDVISNDVEINAKQLNTEISVVQRVNLSEGQMVQNEEQINIIADIENKGNVDTLITVEDYLPDGLEIKKVEVIKNGETIDKTSENTDIAYLMIELKKGEKITVSIEATINTSRIVNSEIKNVIIVTPASGSSVYSNEIVIVVDRNIDDSTGLEEPEEPTDPEEPEDPEEPILPEYPDDPDDPNNPDDPDNPDNPDIPVVPEDPKHKISGYVWIDKNANGKREDNEGIENVGIKIIDINNKNTFLKDKNGKDILVKTNKNGKYNLENVQEGKYNIIFMYDTKVYELKQNDNIKDYIIENTDEKVAITNNINLTSNQEIDLELTELTEFDLKIDKYITKVVVQTVNETKTSEYVEKQLAREEIRSKHLAGATVLVEYTIKISNIGELAGYATEIMDYLPKDMTFHSELNAQWYLGEDGNLYNTSLGNTVIQPGESQTAKLVLVKTMTNDNAGTTTNIAEITKTMNNKDYADIDLSNNQSKAEIIVSPATGIIITYIISILNAIVIIAVGMYIIKRKVIGKE